MATLADLVVRGRFDHSGIDQGLQQTVRAFNRASKDMRGAFQSRGSFFPNLTGQGRAAAEQMLQGLQRALASRTATLSQQLTQKIISPEQFERRAAFAASRFNQQLLAGVAELRGRGLLSPDLEQHLTDQLSALGRKAGGETARTLAAGIAAHRKDIGREIDTALQSSLHESRRSALRAGGELLSGLGRQARAVGSALALGVTAPLTALAGVAVRDAAEMDALKRSLLAVAGSAPEAEEQLSRLKEVAKLPGIGFQEAIQGSVRLQAVGFSAERAEHTLRAFANAIALTGGGREQLQSVTVQLGQLAAKGRVLAQDLKPIIEASPAVATALKQIFKSVDSEQIQSELEAAGVSSAQFVDLLVAQLDQLPKVSGGVRNSFENLSDAVFRARAALGDRLLPAVLPLVERLATLAETTQHLDPALVRSAIAFGVVAAAAGPLLIAAGSLATVFGAIATAVGVGLLPVIAVGAPVILGLAALAKHFVENKLAALDAAAAVDQFRDSLSDVAKMDLSATLGNQRTAEASLALRQSLEAKIKELEDKRAQIERVSSALMGTGGGGGASLSAAEQKQLSSMKDALERMLPSDELQKKIDELKQHVQDLQAITGGPSGPAFNPNAKPKSNDPFKEERGSVDRLITLYEELRARKQDAAALDIAQGPGESLAASLAARAAAAPAQSDTRAQLLVLERKLSEGLEIPLQFELPASRVEELRRELASKDWTIRVTPRIVVTDMTVTTPNLKPVDVGAIQSGYQDRRQQTQAILTEAQAAKEASLQHFRDTIQATQAVTSSFGDLADALGDVSPAVTGALRGVESFANGLVSFRAGKDKGGALGTLSQISGVVGMAAGVAQALSGLGLFGKSDQEREREEILKQNNEALDRLRASIDSSLRGGSTLQAAGGVAARVAGVTDIFQFLPTLTASLKAAGLTMSQLESIAKDQGITLTDSKGNVLPSAFRQLADALGITIERMTQFGKNLDDIQRRQSAYNKLFDVKSSPQQQLNDAFNVLKQMDKGLLDREGLTNLNLSSEAGRSALAEGLRDIFKLIDTKQLTANLLGSFADKNELLDAILATKDGLNALSDTANQVSDALTNVPQGFRIANLELIRFNAQAAATAASLAGSTAAPPSQTMGSDTTPWMPRTRPLEPAGTQVEYADHRTYTVNVVQRPGESGDDFARRVVALVTESAVQDNLAAGKQPTDAWAPNPRKRS